MALWNLGSVTDEVHVLVNVPSGLSGPSLLQIADQRRIYAENFLGQTIGSTNIAVEYQGPLVELTVAKTLRQIAAQNNSTTSSSIGLPKEMKIDDITVKRGDSSSNQALLDSANGYHENAMNDLVQLKGQARFFKALG